MSINSKLGRLVRSLTSIGTREGEVADRPPVRPSNIEEGFSSREVPDYNRNARIIYGCVVAAALFFGVLEIGAGVAFRDWGTLVVAAVLLVFAGASEAARRLVATDCPVRAVQVFGVSFVPSILTVTLVKPDLISTLTMAPFLAVVLAIPLASARTFGIILVGTWLTIVTVNILTQVLLLGQSMPDLGVPDFWTSAFRVSAAATAAAFVLIAWRALNLGFWHYRYESSYDQLTRLPNEAYFLEQVRERTQTARSEEAPNFALLFIKLEDIDKVAEALGNMARDTLLYETGRRLVLNVYGADTVAKLGGDRFGLLLETRGDEVDVPNIARRLAGFLDVPFSLAGRERTVGTTIAIVDRPLAFPDLEHLESSVDTALRTARREGRTCILVDGFETQQEQARQLDTGRLVREALHSGGTLETRFQPVVGLASGNIGGFEVRAYWEHPQDGTVPVRDYLRYLEDRVELLDVTRKVLEEALNQMAQWRMEYPYLQPLALFARLNHGQITVPGIVDLIGGLLESSAVEGESLVLQIPEYELLKDTTTAHETLSELRDLYGVRACVDEFGAGGFQGSASLTSLAALAPDLIRFHPSIASGLGFRRREYEELMAQSVITIGQVQGVEVVASNIRTEDQLIDLRDLGCDYASGDYFAGPLAKEMASAFLDERLSWP